MRDRVIEAMEQLASAWEMEADARHRVSTVDPVADATKYRASELRAVLKDVDDATRTLTVEQYAREHGRTTSTVRRWCMRGQLDAQKSPAGDWAIPRNAKRIKKAS